MSDYMNDPMVLRQILMDHYEYPRNHKLSNDPAYMKRHMASDSCIDDIVVESKINNGIIEDIRFDGVACTIATASTSMMSELLSGKTIIENYHNMIDQKEYDEELLQEAVALHTVGKQANRIKCATIGWKAIEEMIHESEAK